MIGDFNMNAILIVRNTEQFPEMERISEKRARFFFDHSERPYGDGTQYMAVAVDVDYQEEEGKEDDIEEIKALALPDVKEYRIRQIEDYDKSSAVNTFYLGTLPMWLNVSERQQLATQISANEAIGRDSMTKWFGGIEFSFPIDAWKQMLVALEVYAGDALNVTESHKAAVNALADTDEVIDYDFTEGYPEKLVFPYVTPEPESEGDSGAEPSADAEPSED